jgi:hypothetical protein
MPNFPAAIPQTILDSVAGHLVLLFLTATNQDREAARCTVAQMLAAYAPQDPQQLYLAAEVISFSHHALDSLGQAANPDTPLNRVIRLRGSAVSLSRQAARSQTKLDKLQAHPAQRENTANPAQLETAPDPTPPEHAPQPSQLAEAAPSVAPSRIDDQATALIDTAREMIQSAEKQRDMGRFGGLTWSRNQQNRLNAQRIAETAKRKQAEYRAAQTQNAQTQTTQPVEPASV